MRQFENVSYGRYYDSSSSLTFFPKPTPGSPNFYSGPVPPEFRVAGIEPTAPKPGEEVRIYGFGRDDLGIDSVRLRYRLLGNTPLEGEITLLDIHPGIDTEDGEDEFAAVFPQGFPPGVVEFFVESEDVVGAMSTVPDGATFHAGSNSDTKPLRVEIGTQTSQLPPIRLSELVARNETGITDEIDGTPDWVEVVNCSFSTVSLEGLMLTKDFPDIDETFSFPAISLEPGARAIVFCDGEEHQGEWHAPFTLDSEKDEVHLIHASANDPELMVALDSIRFENLRADLALARDGCDGEWQEALPTPNAENQSREVIAGDVDANGHIDATDAINILSFLFLAGTPVCPNAGDVNGDQSINLSDAIGLLHFLFLGASPPSGETIDSSQCLSAQ
ncbi:MAG: hypothetical protein AAF517_13595 [Planctomycetota bacterium]